MKTKPMAHQAEALSRMERKKWFALLMEQGTGKTWVLMADAERLYAAGEIDAIAVVAPKGVHTNWILREIPTHMEGALLTRYWTKAGGAAGKKRLEDLFNPRPVGGVVPLRVFAINIDAVNTKDGLDFLKRFLRSTRALLVLDESGRIKNMDAKRTKRMIEQVRPLAKYVRIATGTPITKDPTDIFAQFEFMQSGLLGTSSYRAFKAEYAELMSADHPLMKNMIQRNPKAAYAQVVAKDKAGNPIWRNLEKLQALIAPHSFRVLKRDCLDLPEKIYKTHYFELDPAQRKAYDTLEEESRIIIEDEKIPVQRLAALMKLQQITSGYVIVPRPGEEPEMHYVSENNPRLAALMELVEDIDDDVGVIIWARFRAEIEAITKALKAAGKTFVEYHGGVKAADREFAIEEFQSGRAQYFVGNAQSGGIGLTLIRAEQMIYYSNDFNRETRAQSEDRAHRIGQKKNVVYTDLAAIDTIDQAIAASHQRKENLAAHVLGDLRRRRGEIIPS